MSVSGVQTKHSLRLEGTTLTLVERGGEYLLKPVPGGPFERLEDLPANEHLTMQIASQVFSIRVAGNALLFFPDGAAAYLTRRFDVLADGRKASQEDLAQVAGRSEERHGPNYKYDLSYEELAGILRRVVAAYPVEVERFFAQVLFNYLVHNGDAHLKNFSLYRLEEFGDYVLTPAYDLLNTKLHVGAETDTALPLFQGDFATESYAINGKYAQDDFAEFGARIGIRAARVRRIVGAFGRRARARIEPLVARSFLSEEAKGLYLALLDERVRRIEFSHAGERPPGPRG
jgi:serine/threonine-protein kinase HipA